jgi:hypothetical protein
VPRTLVFVLLALAFVYALLALGLLPDPTPPAAAVEYERRVPEKSEKPSVRTRIPEREAGKVAPAISPDVVVSLQERVAALEAQVEALQEIVQVHGANVRIEAPANLTLEAGAALKTRAGSTALHEAAASLEVKSPLTKLPEGSLFGGRQALRVGAKVTGVCPPNGGALGGGTIQNP